MLRNIIFLCICVLCIGQASADQPDSSSPNTSQSSQTTTGGNGTSGDISSEKFKINVGQISPGWSGLIDKKADKTVKNVLQRIIERMIIAIGTLALFVMIIGAGQIILYTGDDERLSRWKTVFTAWLIAVALALLSGLMVQLVAYLLYI